MSTSPSTVRSTSSRALAMVLAVAAASCAPPKVDSAVEATPAVVTAAATSPGKLDVLFMIDNSSSMTLMQQKLATQIPGFVTALQNLPTGLPDVHIAVVSSDMGAMGDLTFSIGCTARGDGGQFRLGGAPGGADAGAPACAGVSLSSGATFISNAAGVANYTGDLSTLLSCMTALGDSGCGFENQLGSIARALGADGSPAPGTNAGFLRPDAQLAIIVLSNEDDCSAPVDTELYSLDGGQQNIANPLGPVANYRCNQFGHLCVDPTASGSTCLTEPPLQPPADAQVTASGVTLDLTDCESDDSSGPLTPVISFVNGIRALKSDPDNQIVVGAIVAPPTPYTVTWLPETGGQNTLPGELWPSVEHSCGPAGDETVNPNGQPATDGSFGDPAVRIAQWVHAFGGNGFMASICDGDYANAFNGIVSKIGAHLAGGTGTTSGAGGTSGLAGVPLCPGGVTPLPGTGGSDGTPHSGLQNGGCDIAGGHPAATGLGALLLFPLLFFAISGAVLKRRRVSARRSTMR